MGSKVLKAGGASGGAVDAGGRYGPDCGFVPCRSLRGRVPAHANSGYGIWVWRDGRMNVQYVRTSILPDLHAPTKYTELV